MLHLENNLNYHSYAKPFSLYNISEGGSPITRESLRDDAK